MWSRLKELNKEFKDINEHKKSNKDMSFQMKHSTLLNLKRKSEQGKKSNNDIKNSHDFFKKPGDNEEFENEPKNTFLKSSNT